MADVDEFELVDVAAPDAARPPQRPRRRQARRTARPAVWLGVAAAMVLVGALAAPDDGIPLGRPPAGQVGTLAVDLTRPPSAAWATALDRPWRGGERDLVVVDDVVVVTAPDGAWGLGLADGRLRWSVGGDDPVGVCTVHRHVVCVRDGGTPEAVVTRVAVVDGVTDRTALPYARIAVDAGADLVAVVDGPGDPVIRRTTRTGEIRWELVSPVDLALPDESMGWTEVHVIGDRLYLSAWDASVVDLATGEPVSEDPVWASREPFGFALLSPGNDGVSTTLLGPDGDPIAGDVAAGIDDDPADRLRVDHGDRLRLLRDEVVVWEAGGPNEWSLARLDGVLVTGTYRSDGALEGVGRDLPSGAELWRGQVEDVPLIGAGSTLVTASAHGELAAVDVHTGTVLWRYRVGARRPTFVAVPDGIVLLAGNDVVRLRW